MYGSVPKVICAPYTTPEGYQPRLPDIPLFSREPDVQQPEKGPEGQA